LRVGPSASKEYAIEIPDSGDCRYPFTTSGISTPQASRMVG
jgi:hypothetical protein